MVYRPYSPATKVAVARMLNQGYPKEEIRKALGESISDQSFTRWLSLYNSTQRVVRDSNKYKQRGAPLLLTAEDRAFMLELVCTEPGLFLDEIRERVYDDCGKLLSVSAIHLNLINKMEVTLKKANTVNIKKSLAAKFAWVEKMALVPAEYLVFTDESGICSRDLLRTFSRSIRGTEANRTIVEQNAYRYSLIPAISYYGVLATSIMEDTVKGKHFKHFLKHRLLPRMNPYPGINSILVMDNAKIHHTRKAARLCRDAGIHVVYLPPYCPELNPIELAFSQIKSHLRRTQGLVRSDDPMWAIHRVIHRIVTPALCRSLFSHCNFLCPEADWPVVLPAED